MTDTVYFAIGDVHGELEKLIALHSKFEDYASKWLKGRSITLVHLGDLIDRGDDSAGVIDYVMEYEKNGPRPSINILGNHELLMLESCVEKNLASEKNWYKWGGLQTLDSYYARGLEAPLQSHLDWIAGLPSWHYDKAQDLAFVHAGIDPILFPLCTRETRLWTRSPAFFDPSQWRSKALFGTTVIHGHTPTSDSWPEIAGGGRRINVDTGAVFGGRLTGVIIGGGVTPEFLSI